MIVRFAPVRISLVAAALLSTPLPLLARPATVPVASTADEQRWTFNFKKGTELEEVVRARKSAPELDARALPTEALVEHVVQRYHRALRDALTFTVGLAKKVARVHGEHNPKLLALRDEVEALSDAMLPHMAEEEEVLFPALTAVRPDPVLIQRELSVMHSDHLAVAQTLEAMIGLVGSERVMLGSDYPYDMAMVDCVSHVRSLKISDADKDAILNGNAEKMLSGK